MVMKDFIKEIMIENGITVENEFKPVKNIWEVTQEYVNLSKSSMYRKINELRDREEVRFGAVFEPLRSGRLITHYAAIGDYDVYMETETPSEEALFLKRVGGRVVLDKDSYTIRKVA